MKWTIDSIVHNSDPTVTVRVAITRDDGSVIYDQNCIAEDATEAEIDALCEAMCERHVVESTPRRDLSKLVGKSRERTRR